MYIACGIHVSSNGLAWVYVCVYLRLHTVRLHSCPHVGRLVCWPRLRKEEEAGGVVFRPRILHSPRQRERGGKKRCHIRIIPTENFSPSLSLSLSRNYGEKKVFFFLLLLFSRCPRDLLLRFEVHAVKRGERGKKFWWHHSLTHSTYVRRCVVMVPASFHFASRVPRRKKNEDDDENGKKTKQCLHVSFFLFRSKDIVCGRLGYLPGARRDSSAQITTIESFDDFSQGGGSGPGSSSGADKSGSGAGGAGGTSKRRRSSLAQLTDLLRDLGGSRDKEKSAAKSG